MMHRTNSEGGASSTASSQRWRIPSALRKFGSISGSGKDDKNATVCFCFLSWSSLGVDAFSFFSCPIPAAAPQFVSSAASPNQATQLALLLASAAAQIISTDN